MQLYEPSSLPGILVWLQRPAIGHPMQEGPKLGGWRVGTEFKQRKWTQANFSSVERFISRRADHQGGMLLFELCEWCVWTGPPWNFSSLLITQTYGPAKAHIWFFKGRCVFHSSCISQHHLGASIALSWAETCLPPCPQVQQQAAVLLRPAGGPPLGQNMILREKVFGNAFGVSRL